MDRRTRGSAPRGSPAGSRAERSQLRRHQPLTWRSAALFLVPLALLAAGMDTAAVATAMTRCPRCGGHHLRPDLTLAAFAFTGMTVLAWVVSWRDLRKAPAGGKHPTKPAAADPKMRERKPQERKQRS